MKIPRQSYSDLSVHLNILCNPFLKWSLVRLLKELTDYILPIVCSLYSSAWS